ncbi:MAG TPA: hypothetical protein V6D14_19205 [Coleofasciculaceae cyanobacterium]
MKVPLFKAGLSLLSLFATAKAVRTDRNLVETFRWNVFTEQPTALTAALEAPLLLTPSKSTVSRALIITLPAFPLPKVAAFS